MESYSNSHYKFPLSRLNRLSSETIQFNDSSDATEDHVRKLGVGDEAPPRHQSVEKQFRTRSI